MSRNRRLATDLTEVTRVRLSRYVACVLLMSLGLIGSASGYEASPRHALADDTQQQDAPPVTGPDQAGPLHEPPALGAIVIDDPLTGPGIFEQRVESSHRVNIAELVGEGFIFKVTGPAHASDESAGLSVTVRGLTVPDGEVRVEVKPVSGHDRAQPRIWFRDQGPGQDGYLAAVEPALGRAQLLLWSAGEYRVLAERDDLAGLLAGADWNTMAVRFRGPNIWLLIGDTPVLRATDPTLGGGGVSLALKRTGSLDDDLESAAVFRNLRVSALAGGAADRGPTYAPPVLRTPAIGRIYFSAERDGARRVETDTDRLPAGLPVVHAFYDHSYVVLPNTIRAYWLRDDRPTGSPAGAATPSSPTGYGHRSLSDSSSRGLRPGRLTLVVELNGHEAARRDLILE